jgi:sulfate adenylyltransferase
MHKPHLEMTLRACLAANAKLLVQPVVGQTSQGDIDRHTRMKCYKAVMHRYPEGMAHMSAVTLTTRNAGPR